jgi:hypothetical protein
MLNVEFEAVHMNLNLLCAALVSLLLASGVGMAQQPCRSTVLVTALDWKTDQPIDGLASDDFHAKFEGREISIRAVAVPRTERRFVFVLDRSGSMTDTDELRVLHYDPNKLMRLFLVDTLSAVPKGDTVAFLDFAGQYSHQTEFMQPAKAIEDITEALTWKHEGKGNKHRTALWASILAALRMLSSPRPGDVMVVISDGGDNLSSVSEVQVRGELLSAGVAVLALILARPDLKTSEQREAQQSLFDLVKATGGNAEVAGSPVSRYDGEVVVPFRPGGLISQLAHQYELQLDAPSIEKPEKWELGLNSSESRRKVKLFYPGYLQPCPAIP